MHPPQTVNFITHVITSLYSGIASAAEITTSILFKVPGKYLIVTTILMKYKSRNYHIYIAVDSVPQLQSFAKPVISATPAPGDHVAAGKDHLAFVWLQAPSSLSPASEPIALATPSLVLKNK